MKRAPPRPSRRHRLLVQYPLIPRVVTPLSLQNPPEYLFHRFHRLVGRMENPRNCTIHSHLTHTVVFINLNTRHYLQRTVALYKNLRLCCEAQSRQRGLKSSPLYLEFSLLPCPIVFLFSYKYRTHSLRQFVLLSHTNRFTSHKSSMYLFCPLKDR
jgi:hypothetical protein